MKKILILFFLSLLSHGIVNAQLQMQVPFGSFEQWTSHPGYSINAVVINLPMYDSYSTPTGWNYLSYPVNESINMGFMNITVNTDVPLIVASQETGNVPDGSSAVQLQTFMINEIIDPTVLSMASSYIDTSLTNTIIPSILSTGEVNVESFMPIMTDLMSNGGMSTNPDSLLPLLSTFMTMDVNQFISGGISLGGFEPSYLTGYYKYHSADSGDNGGIILIGTHYNSTLGKREVVGGGLNIALTDCIEYDSFAVEYVSLNTLNPSYVNLAPDSLIVLLVSSASINRQQGSWLCVDNLILWQDTSAASQPDTCPGIADLSVTPSAHEVLVSWSTDGMVISYELEYGEAGFQQGNGTYLILDENSYLIEQLESSTQYDLYIRTVCSAVSISDWRLEHFFTLPDTCARISSITIDSSNLSFNSDQQVMGYRASWQSSFDSESWELEYGPQGFTTGSGISDIVESPSYFLGPLQPNSNYEFRVRSICNDEVYGEWYSILFRTANQSSSESIQLSTLNYQLSVFPNPANGQCVVSVPDVEDVELRLYALDGSLLQSVKADNPTVAIELPSQGVFFLQLVTPQGSATRKIVNR